MKKTFSSKKSAFSLIELSIVLIVIGLLIAGITGGASLIKSSELRSVMGEARGYAVAVNAFYSQFNALPGDYGTAVGSAAAGDGDSTIEYYSAATAAGSESANAWVALKAIGAVTDITTTSGPVIATTAPSFGATAPASKVKSSGWAFDYRSISYTTSSPFTAESASQNVVVLSGAIGTAVTITSASATAHNSLVNGTNVSSAALLASDALSIDAKIDDGAATTGKVKGLNPGVAAIPAAASTAVSNCYFGSAAPYAYNTSNSSKSCALTYQVDVNS